MRAWWGKALTTAAFACVCATVIVKAQQLTAEDLSERAAKARELAQLFTDRLKLQIHIALKNDGPVAAISACTITSPEIATTLSQDSPFEVARTAMRVRNPENAPDPWEQAVLETFQRQLEQGADPKTLEFYETTVTKEGDKLFRYMRPIMMGEMCLTCHGSDIRQDVKAEIAKYYPDDKATGFKLGELRGAYSLVELME
jgi:hypothetical protein